MPIYVPGKVVLAKEFTQQSYMWEFPAQYGLWSPANITTALWLDAADASTVTTVSSAVSEWRDKSGNNRNASQPTSSRRPIYSTAFLNSKAVVSFDGSNDILGFSDRTLASNVSAISYFFTAVSNNPSTSDYHALIDVGTNPGNDRATVYFRSSTIEAGGRRLDSDSYQFHQAGAVTTSACIGSVLFDYQTTSLGIAFNGSAISYRAGSFQTAGTTSNTNSTFISIGATTDTGVDAFTSASSGACNCRIAEIIAVQSSVPTSTREKLEGYLAHKWGLTANLPAGHPYKTVGPTP